MGIISGKGPLDPEALGIDTEVGDEEFAEVSGGDAVDRGIERLISSAARRPAAANAAPFRIAETIEPAPAAPARPRLAPAEAQRPLGERLVEMGLVSRAALDAALAEQERSPHKLLGRILNDMDAFVPPSDAPAHDPLHTLIDPEALRLVPADLIRSSQVLPISRGGGMVIAALSGPARLDAIEDLRPYLPAGTRIEPCFWPAAALEATIEAVLDFPMGAEAILKGLARGTEERGAAATVWADPAVRLVNAALLDAIRASASHVHFEPVDGFVRIRTRVDGAMHQSSSIDKRFWAPVAGHLCNLAGLGAEGENAADQPGEFSMRLGDRTFDCALKAFETLNGTRMTIRIVEIAREPMALPELGLSDHAAALLLRSLVRPSGLLVVAGGRASGRTTTLYGILGEMKAADRSIFTVERRIGYRLPLVSQLEVSATQAKDPVTLLADVVAQDPDVILFDKMEGAASARGLTNAAAAGRLVLTTMDAPDALSALIELIGTMPDPRQLAGRVTMVMAQRLVRRLCSVCKESRPASADECFIFGLDPAERPTVYHPAGCPSCRNTGYRGRTLVSEVLVIDDDMNDLIASGAGLAELRALATDKGFQTLAEDGVRKVLLGEVSPRELARAVDLAARL